jgi:3-hydroxybutyryl-CoA dehydratase
MSTQVIIAQQATIKKNFTKSDLDKYSQLINDKTSSLTKNSFVPEPLLAGIFSMLLGTILPGEGTIYLKQELNFLFRAKIEDELLAKVEITNIRIDKGLITCKTTCLSSKNEIICQGEALVMNKEKVFGA